MQISPVRHYDLLIFDDILPHDFSPFRTLEYRHYLSFFDSILFSMEGWHPWIGNDTFESCLKRLPLQDELKTRIVKLDESENVTGRLAYVTFLGNAFRLVDYFELRDLPFIFQLYPGGGFEVDQAEADERLKRVLHSPMLKKVITTQKLTKNYIVEKIGCDENKIVEVYGGVFDSRVGFDFWRDKQLFPTSKATIDFCFVAHRYANNFSSKGFDQFVAIAQALSAKHPHLRFHVVGDYSAEDIDLGASANHFTFYGKQPSSFFSSFYASMDIIISINRPFTLAPGSFDGFPTGACLEAGFRGVLNCINDPLDLNVVFTHEKNVILLDYDTDRSIGVLDTLVADPPRMYEIAYRNWRLFSETFNLDRQLWTRTEILAKELMKSEAIISSPRISWSALRELRGMPIVDSELVKRLQKALDDQIQYTKDQIGVTEEVYAKLINAGDYIKSKDKYIAELHGRLEAEIEKNREFHSKLLTAQERLNAENGRIVGLNEATASNNEPHRQK